MEDQQSVTIEIPDNEAATFHPSAEPPSENQEEKMTYNEPGKTYADLDFPQGNTGSPENSAQQEPKPQENKIEATPSPVHEHDFSLIDKNDRSMAYCKCGESKGKNPGGRPSKYNQELLDKATEYFNLCYGLGDGKRRFPYIAELQLILGVDDDQIVNYAKEHEEFGEVYNKIKLLQKFLTESKLIRGVNVTGAIFFAKCNLGMIETERKIIAGGNGSEPLQIEFVPEKKMVGSNGEE